MGLTACHLQFDYQDVMVYVFLLMLFKERDSLLARVDELGEMLEAEQEKLRKKAEEISSDEDAEHLKQATEESLQLLIDELHEENQELK